MLHPTCRNISPTTPKHVAAPTQSACIPPLAQITAAPATCKTANANATSPCSPRRSRRAGCRGVQPTLTFKIREFLAQPIKCEHTGLLLKSRQWFHYSSHRQARLLGHNENG